MDTNMRDIMSYVAIFSSSFFLAQYIILLLLVSCGIFFLLFPEEIKGKENGNQREKKIISETISVR